MKTNNYWRYFILSLLGMVWAVSGLDAQLLEFPIYMEAYPYPPPHEEILEMESFPTNKDKLLENNEKMMNSSCEDEWQGWTNVERIYALLNQDSIIWTGTVGGLVRWNKSDGSSLIYTTVNSNLPSNYIRVLKADIEGNIWIGTNGGLVKFDGNNTWEIYNTSNSGLPYNSILALDIDIQGNVWIGTYGGGLAKFDGTNNWEIYNVSNSSLSSDSIQTLEIDLQNNVWIGTVKKGIAKFDGNSSWEIYNTSNSSLVSDVIWALESDNQNNIWICTTGGLTKFDGNNSWVTYNQSNSGLIYDIGSGFNIDAQGNIWIGMWDKGLAKFDGNTNWETYNIQNNTYPENIILTLETDLQGNIWVGTSGGGLEKFDGINNWEVYNASMLLGNNVQCLGVDSEDNVWLGMWTQKGGILKFDGVDSWETYDEPILQSGGIRCLKVDDQDNIWFSSGGGLVKFDGDSTLVQYSTSNSNLPNNGVTAIEIDTQGNIWVGTYYGGLAKFDGNNTWEIYNTSNSGLPSDNIECIEIDSQGNIWIGTTKGLAKFNENDAWTVYDRFNTSMRRNHISDVEIDGQGDIWIGIWDGGIAKFDGNTNWEFFGWYYLKSWYVHDIEIDALDNIWIGTWNGGLSKYDGDSCWENYTTANSNILSNTVKGLGFDTKGNLWMGYVGLTRFNPSIKSKFTQQNVLCSPITFTNKTLGATSYQWQINGNTLSTQEDFTYTFTQSGIYQVSLIASDSTCTDTYTRTIEIPAFAGELNLPVTIESCNGAAVTLDAGVEGYASYEWFYNNSSLGNQSTLTVNQLGDYTLTVVDSCGNTASDTISVICNKFDISGAVYDCNNQRLSGTQLSLSGTASENTITQIDGTYSFLELTSGNYTLTPSKTNTASASGITGLDVLLIQRHILGNTPLSEPCQLIAADVNGNCEVTGLDILWMKQIILGNWTEFPSGAQWRFVPDDYGLPTDGTVPCNFPETIEYSPLLQNEVEQDFKAIKLGDVSGQ